ncbi:unnamed protein product [Calypogeia fissa]
MDWDATSQHPGSPTSEAISGPVDDLREEDPAAGSESPSDGQAVMNQQTAFQSPPPSNSEQPGSPSQGEVEVVQMEEPQRVIVVTSESSEMQVCKPLQDKPRPESQKSLYIYTPFPSNSLNVNSGQVVGTITPGRVKATSIIREREEQTWRSKFL